MGGTHGLSEVNSRLVEALVKSVCACGDYFVDVLIADHGQAAVDGRDGTIELKRGVYPGVILRIGRYEKAINTRVQGRRIARFCEEKHDIVIE